MHLTIHMSKYMSVHMSMHTQCDTHVHTCVYTHVHTHVCSKGLAALHERSSEVDEDWYKSVLICASYRYACVPAHGTAPAHTHVCARLCSHETCVYTHGCTHVYARAH